MKLLFLGYHYLGSLTSLAVWLAKQGHEVLYASSRSAHGNMPVFAGIKRVLLKRFTPSTRGETALDALENAVQTARNSQASFKAIRESGFLPDMILTESSGGAALSLHAVFPKSFWLNFLESAILRKGCVRNLNIPFFQLGLAQRNFVFLPSLRELHFGPWAASLEVFPPVVNPLFFSPASRSSVKNLLIISLQKKAESFIRSIAQQIPTCECVILADNAHSARSLSALARDGFTIMQCASMEENRELFRKARIAIFDCAGDKLLWAMACGCACFVTKNVAREDLPPGIIRFPESLANFGTLLANSAFIENYGNKCREIILRYCDLEKIIPSWFQNVCTSACKWRDDLKLPG